MLYTNLGRIDQVEVRDSTVDDVRETLDQDERHGIAHRFGEFT